MIFVTLCRKKCRKTIHSRQKSRHLAGLTVFNIGFLGYLANFLYICKQNIRLCL